MRSPAHSTDLEQSVLGALLIEPDSIVDVMAVISPADFYDALHRDVFTAMVELYEHSRGFDLVTLSDKLKEHELLNNAGGSVYLAELTTVVPTASNASRHASLIRDKAIHRAVATAGEAIKQLGTKEELDAHQVLDLAEQQIMAVSRLGTTADPETPYDIGQAAYERYAELHDDPDSRCSIGLQSGFSALDMYLQGLDPGALVVIAARPSLGKTSLALNIGTNVARQQKSVAFFSLEMDKQQIFDRLLTSEHGIDVPRLRQGMLSDDEFKGLPPAIAGFEKLPLYIDDDCDTSLANLRSKARRIKMQRGLDLLIVDYLQLIDVRDRAAGENRTQQVSYLSRSLKTLARELGCPIIALSQLSRAVELRSHPIPILSDLRDSGSIEQDADMVLMLYREDVYNEDCSDPGVTDVYIRKNRNGATGRVSLFFDAERMQFRTMQCTAASSRINSASV